MQINIIDSLANVSAEKWNTLANYHPFLRYEFLSALEKHHCLHEYGWLPQHIVLYDEQQTLLAACPLYLKDNSYGELVFDWAWADAYHRNQINYYPKLVSAIPYTPATSPRLLLQDNTKREHADILIQAALELANKSDISSMHWLFPNHQDWQQILNYDVIARHDCQYHWHNQDYQDFDDFLAQLTAKRRKTIKRERRYVTDNEIQIKIVHGNEMTDELWQIMHRFYRSTFEKKSGHATLSLNFFHEISQTMGAQIVLIFAYHHDKPIAGAINFRSDDTLYGRHWGCSENFNSLHFEACYYQGIDYCIRHKLQHFEPGAQGEHKVLRGFHPTLTQSAHWIKHPQFRQAIKQYCDDETEAVKQQHDHLTQLTPYKQPTS